MKKLTLTLALLLTLSIINFADDGHTPGGGKSCPNPNIPCLVEIEPETESTITKTVKILISFFI